MQPSPPLKPDACNLTTPNGDIPNLSNCSEYFTCDNGLSILRTCPTGLYFNNDTKNCDFPRNIKTGPCRSSTNTTTTTRPINSTSTTTTPVVKTTRPTKPTDKKTTTKRQSTHKRLMATDRIDLYH